MPIKIYCLSTGSQKVAALTNCKTVVCRDYAQESHRYNDKYQLCSQNIGWFPTVVQERFLDKGEGQKIYYYISFILLQNCQASAICINEKCLMGV